MDICRVAATRPGRTPAIGLCLSAMSCATRSPGGTTGPAELLSRAIAQAGGSAALANATAFEWEGDATVHAGGRVVRITGRWQVQPPDTAVVTTWDVTRGPASARSLVLASPRGWFVRDTTFTPMPPSALASERDEFYLYDVMRLIPHRDPAVSLEVIPPDSLAQRGFRARRADRPDVELYVDDDGRLAHLRTRVVDASTGERITQDVWLEGIIESAGARWPRRIYLTMAGAPFFDLTLRTFRVIPRVTDPLVAGPR